MEKFNKNNINLLKQYFRTGQLPFFLFSTILNGTDKTSLQLSRIAARNKILKRLKRQFKNILKNDSQKINLTEFDKLDVIWFCWFQGVEDAPNIVKLCFESLKKYSSKKIVLITESNFKKFTNFPQYILDKYNKGIISKTHFSDLLRVELLSRYGGIWVDSTVLFTNNIPQYISNGDLFFYQNCKPGRDGNKVFVSSWLIATKPNNNIILKTRELLFSYWEKKSYLVDYFLFHEFFCLACERYVHEYLKVKKHDNSAPHYLQLEWENNYDTFRVKEILNSSDVHKLTYKNEPSAEDTMYDVLFKKRKIFQYQERKNVDE